MLSMNCGPFACTKRGCYCRCVRPEYLTSNCEPPSDFFWWHYCGWEPEPEWRPEQGCGQCICCGCSCGSRPDSALEQQIDFTYFALARSTCCAHCTSFAWCCCADCDGFACCYSLPVCSAPRPGAPAACYRGDTYWVEYGMLHNERGPAIVRRTGEEEHYCAGLRHNANGPAWTYTSPAGLEFREWWEHGRRVEPPDILAVSELVLFLACRRQKELRLPAELWEMVSDGARAVPPRAAAPRPAPAPAAPQIEFSLV